MYGQGMRSLVYVHVHVPVVTLALSCLVGFGGSLKKREGNHRHGCDVMCRGREGWSGNRGSFVCVCEKEIDLMTAQVYTPEVPPHVHHAR